MPRLGPELTDCRDCYQWLTVERRPVGEIVRCPASPDRRTVGEKECETRVSVYTGGRSKIFVLSSPRHAARFTLTTPYASSSKGQ